MENFQELVAILKKEFSIQTATLRADFDSFSQEIKKSLNATIGRITSLENRIASIEADVLSLKRCSRKNNIIVSGLEVGDDIISSFVPKMRQLLNIDLSEQAINDIYKLNKEYNPPIKVEFSSYRYKLRVMKNKNKLKSTKIFINDDLCPEDREQLKLLRKHLHLAKSKKLNAYLKNGKLYIDGKVTLPEDIINIPHNKILEEESVELSGWEKVNNAPDTPATVSRIKQLAEKYEHLDVEEGGRLQRENTNFVNILQNTEDISRQLRSKHKPVSTGTGIIPKPGRKKNF